MTEQRTESELLFDQYLIENGYVFESQPKILPGKTKKLDDQVSFEGAELFFEVKEFKEGNATPDGAFDPYKRIYTKIKESWAQLNEYREYSCSVVLYNGSAAPVALNPTSVLGAMLGTLTYGTDTEGKLTHKFFGEPSGFRTGHMIDFENRQPRSTQFSSVIVLEKFPLGQIKLSPLLDQRKQHRPKKTWYRRESGGHLGLHSEVNIRRLRYKRNSFEGDCVRESLCRNPLTARLVSRPL